MAIDNLRIREDAWLVEDIVFQYNPTGDGSGTLQLPVFQRQWAWKHKNGLKKMTNLIDSAIRGFPIPCCILNRVSHVKYDIYDGRHRIETMYKFKNDEFKWNDKLYSELSAAEKETFNERRIPMTILTGATSYQLAEAFIRLNSGSHLKDYDMFWAWKEKPLLQAVERLVLNNERLSVALGNVDLKYRPDLANWVALVYGLATHNSGNITTSYLRISNDEVNNGLDIEVNDAFVTAGITAFIQVLETAWARAGVAILDKEKTVFKKVGKIAAFFLHEWITSGNKPAVIAKWGDVLVRYRTESDMKSALTVTGAQNLNDKKITAVLERLNTYLVTGRLPGGASVDSEDE
jgi:hypothetical protein